MVTKLKGFKDYIYIYCPKNSLVPVINWNNSTILSDIKTHAFNIPYYSPTNELCEVFPDKEDKNEEHLKITKIINAMPDKKQLNDDATIIVGRDNLLNSCYEEVSNQLKKNLSSFIVIKGIYGCGKSLFIRCLLKKIVESNYELSKVNKFKFIFNSFQLPNSLYDPLNGFRKILRDIYSILIKQLPCIYIYFDTFISFNFSSKIPKVD